MSVLALIPARKGSKGIKNKNFRPFTLDGRSLYRLALECAEQIGADVIVESQDLACARYTDRHVRLLRPDDLAQDDTPMIAVVQHALAELPGQPDDIIVLLQPTQPLRKPEHVQQAITLLRESDADSVVSVVELPRTHSPEMQCIVKDGCLWPWRMPVWDPDARPATRQAVKPTYIPDGTVYAFWRNTIDMRASIYGRIVRPLIIDPADTCELDSEADWTALEARWRARHASQT